MKRVEQKIIPLLEGVIGALLAVILLLVGALVVLRYVFNSSIQAANEVITILFIYSTALGAAVGVARWEHIAIPVLVERIPARWRWLVDLLAIGLVALLNGVVLAYSIGWIRTTGQYEMASTGWPRWVVQLSIPLGTGCVLFFCGCRAWRCLRPTDEGENTAGSARDGSDSTEV